MQGHGHIALFVCLCACEFPPRCKLNKGEEMPIEDTKQGKVAQYLQVGCLSKKEGIFK
jgi:hypothetical protein